MEACEGIQSIEGSQIPFAQTSGILVRAEQEAQAEVAFLQILLRLICTVCTKAGVEGTPGVMRELLQLTF